MDGESTASVFKSSTRALDVLVRIGVLASPSGSSLLFMDVVGLEGGRIIQTKEVFSLPLSLLFELVD